MIKKLAVVLLIGALIGAAVALWPRPRSSGPAGQILAAPTGCAGCAGTARYAQAIGPREWRFPEDYGPHPDFQTEWWYYTGNVQTTGGRHLGYELTLFRRAIAPPGDRQPRASHWAADQAYMAHLALTDVQARRFQSFERLSRGAAGLAGSGSQPYHVWLENWSIEQTGSDTFRLRAAQDGIGLDLSLRDAKGPILQGDRGLSQKGAAPGSASYYYSQPRLETTGTITTSGESLAVSGLTWMDHEFSTQGLEADLVGWDWFAIQLDNNTELMLYRLRQKDGSASPFSSGTLIEADGSTRTLGVNDVELASSATWRSPRTGATYPAQWTIRIPQAGLRLEVQPYLADQELGGDIAYWEGAVRITGDQGGHPVHGNGYVELTGYAARLGGKF